MAATKAAQSGFKAALQKWVWTKSGFHKYGLKAHDILRDTPILEEAVRRLPADVYDQRQFRISRALQLSFLKTYLPEDQWTKYEEEDYYLKPYYEEVEREINERKEWAKK